MARYYFNLRFGLGPDKLAVDPEGDEIPDVSGVRTHALQAARDLIERTRSDIVRDWFDCTFEITDADGQLVLTVPFGDTVPEEDDDTAEHLASPANLPCLKS